MRELRRKVPKLLTRDEYRRLLEEARNTRLEVVVRLALECGLRRDEIRWLHWADVDFDRGLIAVTAKGSWSPKHDAEREVYVRQALLDLLKRHREALAERLSRPIRGSDWVAFYIPDDQRPDKEPGQWTTSGLTEAVRKLWKQAGIEKRGHHTLHALRGTFATSQLEAGVSPEALRDALGHVDLRTTAMYVTATDQAKRKMASAVDWDAD